MKHLPFIPLLFFGMTLLYSCHNEPIGFLTTEYAVYSPDSLVLKSQLDTTYTIQVNPWYETLISAGLTPKELATYGIYPTETVYSNQQDYQRYKNGTPWVSASIQGLKGTAPIKVEVSQIKPAGAAAELLKSLIEIRGSSGAIIIPGMHKIPSGEYSVSLRFSNEGWNQERSDIFRIIVQ